MAYGDFKDLNRRTTSDKVLRDKALHIAKIQNSNVDLIQWFIIFFDKITSGSGIKTENISNKELSEELLKPIIRNFNKRKVLSTFIDNIWGFSR